jgi:digeranylgeranylglycerophospholipid reductase
MNISIIGAGPVGCYAGYLLAKAGQSVTIFENHSSVGSPIQCTGLLTADFDEFEFPMDSFLVNIFSGLEIHSPGKKMYLPQKEYLVCRNKFDNFFADLAREEGAQILTSHSFMRKEREVLIIKDAGNNILRRITPDIVIAADGPLSPTAKAFGLYHTERENFHGIQAVVEGNFNSEDYQVYFGKDVCPGFFAWIVPESATTARVGLAGKRNTKYYFDKFMRENGFSVKEMQAGTIPIFHPGQKLSQDNCYLLGDAAGYVKATTLGGLVPGLKQAEILVNCIVKGKDYGKEIKPLRRKMMLHKRMSEVFEKMSDGDWDKLISYIGQDKLKKVFAMHTRDNPKPLVVKALLREPRLLRFVKHLF